MLWSTFLHITYICLAFAFADVFYQLPPSP